LPVAKSVCQQVSTDKIVVAADNDSWRAAEGKRNVGIEKAKKAAAVTGAKIAVPIFEKADGENTTDFNDLYIKEGASAVKALILGAKIVQDGFANVEPIDIFGDTSLVGVPGWSKDTCPKAINDFAVDAAQRLGVKTPMVAMPAIICATIAIPDTFRVQPKLYDTDWTELPILWGVTVAPPGEKKSPAHDKASDVIKQIQFRYKDEYEQKFAIYKREKARFDALSKQERAEADPPEKPIMRRKWVDDTTMESLRTVTINNPDGVGIIKDELEGFISSFDVYKSNNHGAGSKDATDAAELFQGKPKVWDRGAGVIFTPNWGASILGTIQPERIKKIAHKIAPGGLLARFLFWEGMQAEEIDRPPHPCCETYYQVIKTLAELKPQYGKQIFKFDKDGIFCREQIRDICRTIMLMPDTSDPLRAHLNKWEAIFSRLCLVYHLVIAATDGKSPQDIIASQTVQMVLTLMIDFLLPNSMKFYKEAVGCDDYISDARWIAGHIFDRKPKKLTPRDISRSYRGLKNKKDLYATMDILDLAGWVEKEEIGKRVVWTVNPMVHTKFAERAKIENERREENKRQLQESIEKFRSERG